MKITKMKMKTMMISAAFWLLSIACAAQEDGPILQPLFRPVARPTPRHEAELLARHERRMRIGINKATARRTRMSLEPAVVYVYEGKSCGNYEGRR